MTLHLSCYNQSVTNHFVKLFSSSNRQINTPLCSLYIIFTFITITWIKFLHFSKNVIYYLSAWRRIEVAITSLTRNQVVGQPARGFESHRLRYFASNPVDMISHCSVTPISEWPSESAISLVDIYQKTSHPSTQPLVLRLALCLIQQSRIWCYRCCNNQILALIKIFKYFSHWGFQSRFIKKFWLSSLRKNSAQIRYLDNNIFNRAAGRALCHPFWVLSEMRWCRCTLHTVIYLPS